MIHVRLVPVAFQGPIAEDRQLRGEHRHPSGRGVGHRQCLLGQWESGGGTQAVGSLRGGKSTWGNLTENEGDGSLFSQRLAGMV